MHWQQIVPIYLLNHFDLYLSQRVSSSSPVEIWQVFRSLLQDQLLLEAMVQSGDLIPWCKGSFESFSPLLWDSRPRKFSLWDSSFSQIRHISAWGLCLSVKQGSASAHLAKISDNHEFQLGGKTVPAKHEELSDPQSSMAGGAAQQTLQQMRQKLKGE